MASKSAGLEGNNFNNDRITVTSLTPQILNIPSLLNTTTIVTTHSLYHTLSMMPAASSQLNSTPIVSLIVIGTGRALQNFGGFPSLWVLHGMSSLLYVHLERWWWLCGWSYCVSTQSESIVKICIHSSCNSFIQLHPWRIGTSLEMTTCLSHFDWHWYYTGSDSFPNTSIFCPEYVFNIINHLVHIT